MIETREALIRSVNEEERTVTGLAVTYGDTADVGYFERFEPGAIKTVERTKLFWQHNEVIGKVIAGRDTDEGFEITARISKTPRGDEAYTLLRDGSVDRFSVGFVPVAEREEDGVVIRTEVDLKEVSLVNWGAYENAAVTKIRDFDAHEASMAEEVNTKRNGDDFNMTEINEVAELREAIDVMEREVATLKNRDEDTSPVVRSGAEIMKGLARNDESVLREVRTWTGSALADGSTGYPAWVNETLRLIVEDRPVVNAFSKAALPSRGNSVEWPYVKTQTGAVAAQAAEGNALTRLGVTLDTRTAPVVTLGGYVSLSRQAIERSDLPFLQTSLEHMARSWSKASEAYTRGVLVGAPLATDVGITEDMVINQHEQLFPVDGAIRGVDVLEAVFEANAKIVDNTGKNYSANLALVSRDIFKSIALLTDEDGRPLFNVSGQSVNSYGSTNVLTPSLSVGGLNLQVVDTLAAGSFYVANSAAIKTWETGPFDLSDEDIITLTKDFSLYSYGAAAILEAKAITKVTFAEDEA